MMREHDRVVLTVDVPAEKLTAGDVGTVVHIFDDGNAYEVEFVSLYPRIVRVVESILENSKVVAPVEVLLRMGLLETNQLEDWRCGRIPYLEQVIHCNLTRLSGLLRILRFHAHDLNLKPSWTAYLRSGKKPRQRLRFTKTGEHKLEEAYATHFI